MVWVDYKQLRKQLDIEQVIADYGIELRGSGNQKKGMCPSPSCRNPKDRTLSVNVARGIWRCWKCDARGNVIDFAALMEDLDPIDTKQFRQAAVLLQEKYKIASKQPQRSESNGRPQRRRPAANPGGKRRRKYINAPLDFALKNLDPEHPSIVNLGLSTETVEWFELGFCERRGLLQGRIAIPIHNPKGELVGYCGRIADETAVTAGNPLYLYPEKERVRSKDNAVFIFDRSSLLYNAHRITAPVENLIVVEDVRYVWTLHEMRADNVVALLGPCSTTQASLIGDLVVPSGTVWFLTASEDAIHTLAHAARTRMARWLIASDEESVKRHMRDIM